MNPATWDIDDDQDGSSLIDRPAPALVSAHFIRAALRRKRAWLVLLMLASLGLGSAYLVMVPPSHTATSTLALSHDPAAAPDAAMLTDVSLATTRAVAQQTINRLGLKEAPLDLLAQVTAEPTTSDILTFTLKASTDREAVRQLDAYTSVYLKFRADQLTQQLELLSQGTNERISVLQEQSDALTKKIDAATSLGSAGTGVGDLISQRAQLLSQISVLQQSVEDATIKNKAIVAASRIIDDAAAIPSSVYKRPVLVLLSCLIVFLALGAVVILFRAIISDRLRSRVEVATALEVPVNTSLGKITPLSPLIAWLPVLRAANARRRSDLQRFARAIEAALPNPEQGQWLAVACVDNAREVSWGAVTAALELRRQGHVVRLIDLTDDGVVEGVVNAIMARSSGSRPIILRPKVAPSLARDASDIVTYGPETRDVPALRETDLFITVADLNPSVGAFHLATWTNRLIVAVTAGLSSAERVRTAADLVQTAGLDLWSGVVIGSEKDDVSSGTPIATLRYTGGS